GRDRGPSATGPRSGSEGLRSADNPGTPTPGRAANPRGLAAPAGGTSSTHSHRHRSFRPHAQAIPPSHFHPVDRGHAAGRPAGGAAGADGADWGTTAPRSGILGGSS